MVMVLIVTEHPPPQKKDICPCLACTEVYAMHEIAGFY